MTTINDVMHRIRRTWLEPPDYQPAGTLLEGAILDTDTTIQLGAFMIPEDEQLVRVGSILEIELELIRVLEYNQATRSAVCERGVYGTTAASHAINTFIRLSGSWSSQSIIEAISDSIIGLYPRLFTVGVEHTSSVNGNVAPLSDDLAVEIISIWPDGYGYGFNIGIEGQIVEYHPAVGGRAVVTHGNHGNIWVRYKRRMGAVSDITDTLEDLGVEERWVAAIMAGAAADLYAGRDIPSSFTEWVGAALEAESVPPGTRFQIASALRNYRDRLIHELSNEMSSEYRPTVEMRSPFGTA